MVWFGRVGWLIGGVLGVLLQITLVFLIPIAHGAFRLSSVLALLVLFGVCWTWGSRDPVVALLVVAAAGLVVVVLRGIRDALVRLDGAI